MSTDSNIKTNGLPETAKRRGRSSKISRERILDAALIEFAESGYEGATTASVARRVNVTQPLIHYHFGSKEALWRAAVELGFARMRSLLQGVEEDMGRASPLEAIQLIVRRFVYFNAKYPEVGRLIIAEAASHTPRLEWMAEQHLTPILRQAESLLEAGKQSGAIKDFPSQSIMFAFLGAVPHFFDSAPLIRLIYGIDPLEDHHVEGHANTLVEVFTNGLLNKDTPG